MRADRRLYLDRGQTALVAEPEAAWLLAATGQEIPEAEVKRLGLVVQDGRVVQASAEPVVEMAAAPEPALEPAAAEPAPAPIMPPQARRYRGRSSST